MFLSLAAESRTLCMPSKAVRILLPKPCVLSTESYKEFTGCQTLPSISSLWHFCHMLCRLPQYYGLVRLLSVIRLLMPSRLFRWFTDSPHKSHQWISALTLILDAAGVFVTRTYRHSRCCLRPLEQYKLPEISVSTLTHRVLAFICPRLTAALTSCCPRPDV